MFATILSKGTPAAAHYVKIGPSLRHFSTEINFAELIKKNKVVVFMKGTPDVPRCGYSRNVVQILRGYGVQFDHHDVLTSRDLREGIKKFSDWPTIPQIFLNGEFIGGHDILLKLHLRGDLAPKLIEAGIQPNITENPKTKK